MCQFPKHLKHLMFLILEEDELLVEGNLLEFLKTIPSLRCVRESSIKETYHGSLPFFNNTGPYHGHLYLFEVLIHTSTSLGKPLEFFVQLFMVS